MLPEGSQAHNHVRRVLNNVAGLGGGPAVNGQANNGHETEPVATATPSTSAAPISTPTRGQRSTTSLSTSATRGRGRPATASPSTSAARGHGQPTTASPSTSAARGRGWRTTTLRVVISLEIPAPILHASPQPEVHPPILDASPQSDVPSPTPPSQPSFDIGIDFHLTPPILPETPSYPPISTSAPAMPVDPPTLSSSDPLRPPVGIITVQLLMYQTSIPLIIPHPHKGDCNILEEHLLVGQVNTK